MIGKPNIDTRSTQHYAGIRTRVPMKELKNVIPTLLGEVFGWLEKKGISPAGAPFIRYHVINMEAKMDVELGVPVASPVPGDGRVAPGVIPAGRYAALVYTGVQNGIEANAALLHWGAEQGLVWDTYASDEGDGFGARIEYFLTAPDQEPSQAKWETEVAIRLAGA